MKENCVSGEVFEEDGVFFRQTIKYDPNAKEALISVPAHLDRISISVVVNEVTTTIITDSSCVVEDTPSDLDVTSEFSKNKTFCNGDITPAKPKVFKIYTDLGSMSNEEKGKLSEGTREACEGKEIHKTKVEEVDETTFNEMKNEQSIVISRRMSSDFLMRSHLTQSTCTNRTVNICPNLRYTDI